MIRPLTPIDPLRFLLAKESDKSNRATTIDSLLSKHGAKASLIDASKSAMSVGDNFGGWLYSRGVVPDGFVIARQMSGRQSWNITHLHMRESGETFLTDLLEKSAQSAGSNGAEKVLVRLLREDSLVDIARLSGYFPRVPEVLYVREKRPELTGVTLNDANVTFARKAKDDEHGLFRLYSATIPAEVRYAIGMTIDQWLSSHENVSGRYSEHVLKDGGDVIGWLGVVRKSGNGHVAAMIHPEHEHRVPSMLDFALNELSGVRRIFSLVPEYQTAFQSALTERGFLASSDYVMLVKAMTIKQEEETPVTVAAPTGL